MEKDNRVVLRQYNFSINVPATHGITENKIGDEIGYTVKQLLQREEQISRM